MKQMGKISGSFKILEKNLIWSSNFYIDNFPVPLISQVQLWYKILFFIFSITDSRYKRKRVTRLDDKEKRYQLTLILFVKIVGHGVYKLY